MQVTIKKLENGEVEIAGELPEKDFEVYRKKALERIGKDIEVPGFRKGHVPEEVLTKKVSEMAVLEEMAQLALGETYPKILAGHKIDAIGQPEISITKLAKNNPFGFKIKTAVMPEVKLPDYKTIAKEAGGQKEKVDVTDEDIEKTILDIRRMRSQSQKHPSSNEASKGHSKNTESTKVSMKEIQPPSLEKEENLPKLDDEFVKTLGDFKDVSDFKAKLKENMKLEKEIKIRDKQRIKIIDAIIEKSTIDLPQLLVDIELDKMIHQLQSDLSASGFKFEDYLKKINKSEADIRSGWKKDAEKRARFQLAVNKISIEENIKADEQDINAEVDRLMETYKGADPQRARALVEHKLVNEKVFQFLEKQEDE